MAELIVNRNVAMAEDREKWSYMLGDLEGAINAYVSVCNEIKNMQNSDAMLDELMPKFVKKLKERIRYKTNLYNASRVFKPSE
jgi:hypothetical protein